MIPSMPYDEYQELIKVKIISSYSKQKPEEIGDATEEYLIETRRCPHIIRKRAGDESYDICELVDKPCLIEHGLYKCEIWEQIQEEEAQDGRTNTGTD